MADREPPASSHPSRHNPFDLGGGYWLSRSYMVPHSVLEREMADWRRRMREIRQQGGAKVLPFKRG